MTRENKNKKKARESRGRFDSPEVSPEELVAIEKRVQAKARAMQAAGISVSIAARTSIHLVEELVNERRRRSSSKGNAASH